MAFNLLLESNNTVSPRDVVYGHHPECSAREQEEEPENDLAFAVVLDQGRARHAFHQPLQLGPQPFPLGGLIRQSHRHRDLPGPYRLPGMPADRARTCAPGRQAASTLQPTPSPASSPSTA
ncbi:hypothetical protein [Nonomuraea sp. GTA35]|uniref:hypothetical protein n=1 Tax=Nonomuraea sp. GTA35 TaxID=1676746 RepID=UPI0035BEEF16